MKVVLFCGGLGTRIRDYGENLPKPMIPVGEQPILWHVMQYYSGYGHRDFVLCLGYKANTIKEFFLNWRQQTYSDCVISDSGRRVEFIGEKEPADLRVTLLDTGVWRNIGERLMAVREHVKDEEMFLANYSDGLSDAPLPEMIELLRKTGKTGCFLAVRPALTFHLVEFDGAGEVQRMRASADSDIWINAGYFVFRNKVFDYIKDGEELVIEPFQRMIDAGELIAYRHEGFFRPMDTLKDKQILEDMVERGETPWNPRLVAGQRAAAGGGGMKGLPLAEPGKHLSVLCLGAHSDDIEIGAGATLLQWQAAGARLDVLWCVLSRQRAARERGPRLGRRLPGGRRARPHRGPPLPRRILPRAGQRHQGLVREAQGPLHPRRHPHPSRRRCASGPSRGQPAHLEHVPRPPDPRIRDPQVGRRPRQTQLLRLRRRDGDGAQGRAAASPLRHAALQALVRRGDVPRPGAPARHGMPGAGPLRGSILREERFCSRVEPRRAGERQRRPS